MQNEQILNDLTYKGYHIGVYQNDSTELGLCDLVVSSFDLTPVDPIYSMKYIKRDEAVLVAQAFIEGILYSIKANK